MATINRSGLAFARSLIAAGSVNKTASWSFSAEDGNPLLGKDEDWANYGKHFLGADSSADAKTKDHWKYPFAKGGTLYRSALTAIRQRAGQQDDTEIFDAAGTLLEAIDKGKDMGRLEHKSFAFELKMDNSDEGTITGYGSVFGNVDQGGDIVRQGAFTDTLAAWKAKGKMPKLLWQHDTRQPIGVWQSMQEDGHGLLVRGKLTKGVRQADECKALLMDGALDGLSMGFQTVDAGYDADLGIRSINKVNLFEVSVVTLPMNEAATVTAVKAADAIRTIRDFEDFLRDAGGFSHAAAKAIAARGFKSLDPRDEDGAMSGLLDIIRQVKSGLTA